MAPEQIDGRDVDNSH
jgi:dipeptidyl aminopeptidase/acylaminoacyl peptidase